MGFQPCTSWSFAAPRALGLALAIAPQAQNGTSSPGSQPFHCLYCLTSVCFPGALQHHVTTEHFKQTESTFTCGLCGELFTSQGELEGHCSAEHPKVIFTEAQATTTQIVQVETALFCSPPFSTLLFFPISTL